MKRFWISVLVLLLAAMPAAAEIRIAATTANMGMLAETIGGDAVDVTVMAPHDRDAHYLEARPSMMAALRNAQLVVAVGADLEVGWLPAAIDGANNRDVRPGRLGYFEAARHVELLVEGGAADRARGDVHPAGDPHFYMSPRSMAKAGHALAERLARMDEAGASTFHANAEAFEALVAEHMSRWREAAERTLPVLSYHGDIAYLARDLGIQLVGTIEPLPGIPPTARHLRELVRQLDGQQGVILVRNYQPEDGARFLQQEIGWEVHQLPSDVQPGEGTQDYLDMIGRYVEAMTRIDG